MRSMRGRPERVLGVALTCTILHDYWVSKRLSTGVLRRRAEDGGRRAEESHGDARRRTEGGRKSWRRGVRGRAPHDRGKSRERLAHERGSDWGFSLRRSVLGLSAAIQKECRSLPSEHAVLLGSRLAVSRVTNRAGRRVGSVGSDVAAGLPARLLQRAHCVQRYWRSGCDETWCASQVRSIGIAIYNRRVFAKIVRGIFHDWVRPSVQVVCGLGEGTREKNIPSCDIRHP